jgi:hypothetical protein
MFSTVQCIFRYLPINKKNYFQIVRIARVISTVALRKTLSFSMLHLSTIVNLK